MGASTFLDLLGKLPVSDYRQPPKRSGISFLDDRVLDEEDGYCASFRGGDHGRSGAQGLSNLKMCTEILCSESGDFMVAADEDDQNDGAKYPRMSSSATLTSVKILKTTSFPLRRERLIKMKELHLPPILPLLSTLNRYGRPRFTVTKVGLTEGRLLIFMEKDRLPRAVAVSPDWEDYEEQSKKLALYYNSDFDQEDDDPMEEEE